MISTDLIKPDFWRFLNTAKAMNGTLSNTAAATAMSGTDLRAATLTATAHGYSAGSHIYIQGTTNYDGMNRIHAVATNTITILRNFVAETPAGTEPYFPGVRYSCPYLFHGFDLHLSAAASTSEDFEVALDADAGALADVKIYDHDMSGVQDIIYRPAIPILCAPNDIIKCTWANTDARNWGLTLIASRLV